jgi:hypothetical protein
MRILVRKEQIRCPSCRVVCNAEVTHDVWMPFDNYHHQCVCGYLIGESEWDVVNGRECEEV